MPLGIGLNCCCGLPPSDCPCTENGSKFTTNGCSATLPDPCVEHSDPANCCFDLNGATLYSTSVGNCEIGGPLGYGCASAVGYGVLITHGTGICIIEFFLYSSFRGPVLIGTWRTTVPEGSIEIGTGTTYSLPFVSGSATGCHPVSGVGDVVVEFLL